VTHSKGRVLIVPGTRVYVTVDEREATIVSTHVDLVRVAFLSGGGKWVSCAQIERSRR
jgi:hypothetical protein